MSDKFTIAITTASGHPVQVVIGQFWQEVAPDENGGRLPATEIHAIHVLTSEDHLTLRLKLRHEFRADFDYSLEAVGLIKAWLKTLAKDRRQGDYENVEEFLVEFGEFMANPDGFQPPKKRAKRHQGHTSFTSH